MQDERGGTRTYGSGGGLGLAGLSRVGLGLSSSLLGSRLLSSGLGDLSGSSSGLLGGGLLGSSGLGGGSLLVRVSTTLSTTRRREDFTNLGSSLGDLSSLDSGLRGGLSSGLGLLLGQLQRSGGAWSATRQRESEPKYSKIDLEHMLTSMIGGTGWFYD